jgi:predicted dehydrogenase
VRALEEASEKSGKTALEAYHWRFQPAAHYVKDLYENGVYGPVQSVYARMSVPSGILKKDDIRFSYDLGGGVSMDCCYVTSVCCYFTGVTKDSEIVVKEAQPRLCPSDRKVDEAMVATTEIHTPGRKPVIVNTDADLKSPPIWGLIPNISGPLCVIELEKATISFDDYLAPATFHNSGYGQDDGEKEDRKDVQGWPIAG